MTSYRLPCPICGQLCRSRGLMAHLRLAHSLTPAEARKALEADRERLEADARWIELLEGAIDGVARIRERVPSHALQAAETDLRDQLSAFVEGLRSDA
jgi:hypothetical protein